MPLILCNIARNVARLLPLAVCLIYSASMSPLSTQPLCLHSPVSMHQLQSVYECRQSDQSVFFTTDVGHKNCLNIIYSVFLEIQVSF